MFIYKYIHYVCMCIYIYREREMCIYNAYIYNVYRERCIYIYIYIFIACDCIVYHSIVGNVCLYHTTLYYY